MRCSTSWGTKSGSSSGCSADPYMVSIVCASNRSRMSSSSGQRLKKITAAFYSNHICHGSSILRCQSAAALVRMEPLQIIGCFIHILFQSCLFFHLNVVTMPLLPAHCNNKCCLPAAVCLQMELLKSGGWMKLSHYLS
jgi:hypothetical protein